MSLRFGSFPVVVGSSAKVAEVLVKTQDLAYLDQSRMACDKHTVYNYSGMLWSHYEPYWRQLRKLWVTELLSARQLHLTERVRAEEVRAMLRDLHPATSTSTAAVVLKERLLMATLNVISRMVLGKKYVGEDGAGSDAAATPEEFRWMIEEIFFLNGALHVGDMVSWLGWLDAHRVRGQDEAAGREVRPVHRARAARARRAAAAGGRRVRARRHG
jgi:typhasterol/6-deoxotyphasterol 2alpha-hydroxylase